MLWRLATLGQMESIVGRILFTSGLWYIVEQISKSETGYSRTQHGEGITDGPIVIKTPNLEMWAGIDYVHVIISIIGNRETLLRGYYSRYRIYGENFGTRHYIHSI